MFDRVGVVVARHWWLIVVGWLALAVILHLVAPRWDDVTNDGDIAYLPANLPSVRGEALLARAFPQQQAKSEFVLIAERPRTPLSMADLLWSDGVADLFRDRKDLAIVDVWNRNTDVVGDKLTSRISKNGQATVTILHVKNEFMAVANVALLRKIEQIFHEAGQSAPAGLKLGISGSAAVGGDMLSSAAESIRNTELTTIALVVLILLVVYRAPLLVMIPLLTIGLSLLVAIDLLALLTQVSRLEGFGWWNFKVFTTTKIFIIVILFGAGTDFCLFLISRYREELQRGFDPIAATRESVARVGPALVGSAMTTICGLGMMFFADFGKFRNSGPAIALSLCVALLACLSLAPALLRAGGQAVFWPFRTAGPSEADPDESSTLGNRFWNWISRAIVRRPAWILVTSIVLMAPLAVQGSSLKLTYDFLNELAPGRPSVLGTEMARRHFSPGEMGPVTVLALVKDGRFNAPPGEAQIARLTKHFYDLAGVERVRSIAEPTGDPPGYFQPFRVTGLKKLAARKHKITKATYLTQAPDLVGDVARFDIVLKEDPFSLEAIEVLNGIDDELTRLARDRDSPWYGAEFSFAGTTAGIRDLRSVTGSDQRLIEQLVMLAVLAVLIVLLRRPLVCLYLIASVLFSYYVTIGVTQLFFTWLYGDTYFGLDWKVPIFLFVILIAVGEDYNIYLVTRVIEEQRRHGAIEGLRRAVVSTGGIITSCGVIMAGTFISMMTGTLRGVFELGFALSLGVMLDTCVVRPVLVPAFMVLVERFRPSQSPVPLEQN